MTPSSRLAAAALACAAVGSARADAQSMSVTTYHNDTLRTGWNASETTLTPASVAAGQFQLQKRVALDQTVYAQPLVVANQAVAGLPGTHTVVYVATTGDTVYALDAATGAELIPHKSFGTPVPQSQLPGMCNNNGPNVGITSTPVISASQGLMWFITDGLEGGQAVFRLHEVRLADLSEVRNVVVSASHTLPDGKTVIAFSAYASRQRAALLLSGGTLYAAFSSYCDYSTSSVSRGWMLGWNADTLAPLPHNQLENLDPSGGSGRYLTSIWMSGYGPSTASPGNVVYFVTGNSDQPYGTATNLDESVIKASPDLTTNEAFFTAPGRAQLDAGDADFGSGGALLTPYQPGKTQKLLAAAGKNGQMYLMDRGAQAGLGLIGTYGIGGCWCGPSYYTDSSGVGRIVTSGGSSVIDWRIVTSASAPATLSAAFTRPIVSGQDPGFFTSVSSDGTQAGSAIVWAVGRPTSVPGAMSLYAIGADSGSVLYSSPDAGAWSAGNSDADSVPTVADGRVYVASDKLLTIYGLGAAPAAAGLAAAVRAEAPEAADGAVLAEGEHAVYGAVLSASATTLVLERRDGTHVDVYLPEAQRAGLANVPASGGAAFVIGRYSAAGVLVAASVQRAKSDDALWAPDR